MNFTNFAGLSLEWWLLCQLQ